MGEMEERAALSAWLLERIRLREAYAFNGLVSDNDSEIDSDVREIGLTGVEEVARVLGFKLNEARIRMGRIKRRKWFNFRGWEFYEYFF